MDRTLWRRLVLAALAERDNTAPVAGPEDRLPEPDCNDMEEWDILFEALAGGILCDADWLDEDLYMDIDPQTSRLRKQRMNIADAYYTAVAPDPSEAELIAIRYRLKQLLGS